MDITLRRMSVRFRTPGDYRSNTAVLVNIIQFEQKIKTVFDFLTPKLTFIEPKKDYK